MSDPQRAQPKDPTQGYARIAEAVVGDVGRVGKSGADALLPGGGPGATRTTQARAAQHLRDAWPYPEEREAIFARMVPTVPGPDGKLYPARNGLAYWENLLRAAFPFGTPVAPPIRPAAPASPVGVPPVGAPPPLPLPPPPPPLVFPAGVPSPVVPPPPAAAPPVPTPPPLSGPQVPY